MHEALDNALALVDVEAIYHRGTRREAAREHGPACFRQDIVFSQSTLKFSG